MSTDNDIQKTPPSRTRLRFAAITFALSGAAIVSIVLAGHGQSAASLSKGPTVKSVLSAVGSSRVKSISRSGPTVLVSSTATGPGADATRMLWYGTIAGVAYAGRVQATALHVRVVGPDNSTLEDVSDPIALDEAATPAVSLSSDVIQARAMAHADALDVKAVRINYVPLLGGVAEFVIEPQAPVAFAQNAGALVPALIEEATLDRPYLATVIDSAGEPLLVLGWTPGMGGGIGQGIAWQASMIHSSAILGQPYAGTGLEPTPQQSWRLPRPSSGIAP